MIPEVGIHIGVSFDDYRSWEAVNWHTLWRLREESPAHARYEQEHGSTESAALAFGRLTDFVLLEPGRFQAEAVIEPEIGEGLAPRRPTQGQIEAKKPSPASVAAIKFWAEWDARNAGKIVITRDDYERVLQIERAVRAAQCQDYLLGGRAQISIVWQDALTGLLCKARLDYEQSAGLNHIITDLKTARSAHPTYWQHAIYHYGYFGQLAWYDYGWRVLTGESSLCGWLVVEKTALCPVVHYEAHEDVLQAGRNAYRDAFERYDECLRTGIWPAYHGDIVNLPGWALQREGVGRDLMAMPETVAADDSRSFEQKYNLGEDLT